MVAVLGPDGSGKSTVIDHLLAELGPAFRNVRRFHLRPYFGRRQAGGPPVTEPHGKPPRGGAASILKVALFLADYWISWLCVVWPARLGGTLVVFDRYYHDMLADPARYRLPPGFALPRRVARLIPCPDLTLILEATPAALVARKGELTIEQAQRLSVAYAKLAARMRRTALVSTDASLERTLAQASALVLRGAGQPANARAGGTDR